MGSPTSLFTTLSDDIAIKPSRTATQKNQKLIRRMREYRGHLSWSTFDQTAKIHLGRLTRNRISKHWTQRAPFAFSVPQQHLPPVRSTFLSFLNFFVSFLLREFSYFMIAAYIASMRNYSSIDDSELSESLLFLSLFLSFSVIPLPSAVMSSLLIPVGSVCTLLSSYSRRFFSFFAFFFSFFSFLRIFFLSFSILWAA